MGPEDLCFQLPMLVSVDPILTPNKHGAGFTYKLMQYKDNCYFFRKNPLQQHKIPSQAKGSLFHLW